MDVETPRTPPRIHPDGGWTRRADNQPIREEQSDSETSVCPKRRRRARRRNRDDKVVRCLFPDLTAATPTDE